MKENFNYQDVPGNYLHCLNAQCPRSTGCLRFQVTVHAGSDTLLFSVINPAHVANQEECSYFRLDRLAHFALGITHLLDNLPHTKALKVRKALYNYFGRNKFSRILNKERLIDPEEQAFIQEVFSKEGIEEEPVFDKYVDKYNWL